MSLNLKRAVVVVGLLTMGLAAATPSVAGPEPETSRTATRKMAPRYPEATRQARLEGTVTLSLAVTLEGRVKSVDAIGGHLLFVEAASDAAKQWRFEPAAKESSETPVFAFELLQ